MGVSILRSNQLSAGVYSKCLEGDPPSPLAYDLTRFECVRNLATACPLRPGFIFLPSPTVRTWEAAHKRASRTELICRLRDLEKLGGFRTGSHLQRFDCGERNRLAYLWYSEFWASVDLPLYEANARHRRAAAAGGEGRRLWQPHRARRTPGQRLRPPSIGDHSQVEAMLQVHRRAAPTLWLNIRYRFSEIPSVSIEILCVVLALAISVLLRLRKDVGAGQPRALTVSQRVVDPYLNDARMVRRHTALGDGEAALAGAHLDAMIRDPQTHRKAKSVPQPRGCHTGIGVVKNGNHRTRRNGTVGAHGTLLNLIRPAYQLCNQNLSVATDLNGRHA